MRWYKILPEIGQRRIRSAFLFLPTNIDGEVRWLETATWEEEYMRTQDPSDATNYSPYDIRMWVPTQWKS